MKRHNRGLSILTLTNHLASVIGTAICLYGIYKGSKILTIIWMILILVFNITGILVWIYEIRSNIPKKYEQICRLNDRLEKFYHNKFLTNFILVLITSFTLFMKVLLPLSLI